MEKKDLRASKDSQGFYTVEEKGVGIVWDGWAANANEAKDLAIEEHENNTSDLRDWL